MPVFVPSCPQVSTCTQSTWIYNPISRSTSASVLVVTPSTRASVPLITPSISASVPTVTSGENARPYTTSIEQGLFDLAKSLADQITVSRLPPPETSVFTGDPLSYPGWKSAFQILIEQKKIHTSERLPSLKRYVSGSIRDVIDGYFLLSSDTAYEEAKSTLDKRYGDPFVIANALRDKLEKWPEILPRDGTGLKKFADFLQQCQIAIQTTKSLSVLNYDRENRKLLSKLPDWIVSRWERTASQWKDTKGEYPPFKNFVEFMTQESKIACDPVISLQFLRGSSRSYMAQKLV